MAKSLNKRQIQCDSFEAYHDGKYDGRFDLELDAVVEEEIRAARAGEIDYAHFGIVCSSWSTLNKINGGTRSRQKPRGDETLRREIVGNVQHDQMMRLLLVFLALGIGFTVENPLSSFLWHTDDFQELLARDDIYSVRFDQCEYHLLPPDHRALDGDVRVRKSTRLITNIPELKALECRCTGRHQHVATLGTCRDEHGKLVRRSTAAGVYPPALCRRWSAAVRAFLDGRR